MSYTALTLTATVAGRGGRSGLVLEGLALISLAAGLASVGAETSTPTYCNAGLLYGKYPLSTFIDGKHVSNNQVQLNKGQARSP